MPCAEYACPSRRGATFAFRIAKSTGWKTPLPTPMIATMGKSQPMPGATPAASAPPPGDFHDWDRDAWIRALDANMLTPIELIKATIDVMIERRYGRIVNITSSAVKAPIDVLGLSNGARSGLTGFVAGLARKVVRHGVTINNLLPGQFDTDRLRVTYAGRAKAAGRSIDEALAAGAAAVPAGRFGNAAEFGAVCAFLCSAHAGYIAGQNVLVDGGNYPGTF